MNNKRKNYTIYNGDEKKKRQLKQAMKNILFRVHQEN